MTESPAETYSDRSSSLSDIYKEDGGYNIESDSSNSVKRKKNLSKSIIYFSNTGGGSGSTTDANPFIV